MSQIPHYFYEVIHGLLWRGTQGLELSVKAANHPPDAEFVMQGQIILRYGIDLLSQPHTLVPGYFESENGYAKAGREAWEFIWAKFQLYPRADVIGLRDDGAAWSGYMRDLDFGEGPKILAYSDTEAMVSLGQITHISGDPSALPPLLAGYVDGG